jgi:gliding motility-associated-like protein
MQTAPDGKLYISKLNNTSSIASVASINSPNVGGTACGFNPYAITLPAPAKVGIGLPNAVVNPVTGGVPDIYVHDTTICGPWTAISSAANGAYTWSTGDTASFIQINTGGTYWVVASSGCGVIDTFHVTLTDKKLHLDDALVCTGDSVIIPVSLNVSSVTTVLWSTGATQSSVVFHDTGIYWVQVTEGSCVANDTMTISFTPCGCEFFLPNAFSPNGDGLNDYFTPKYLAQDHTCTEHFSLKIYSRWGEEVYSGTQSGKGWNGYYKNEPADVGVYMYHLSYEGVNGRERSVKGDVTLLR